MRDTFRNFIKAVLTLFRFCVLKLFYRNKISFSLIDLLDCTAHIKIKGANGRIEFQKKVDIKEYSRIEALNGKIVLEESVFINRNAMIVSMESIRIGAHTIIGPNVVIYDHDHDYENNRFDNYVCKPVNIGENVWIAANVTILKGVTIGDNCVIAAGTVVTKDIPSNMIVYQRRDTKLIYRRM